MATWLYLNYRRPDKIGQQGRAGRADSILDLAPPRARVQQEVASPSPSSFPYALREGERRAGPADAVQLSYYDYVYGPT
jgi:hypothetical protein